MSKILLPLTRQMQWALIPLLLLALTRQVWGQCNNASQYPSTPIDLASTNASGATTTITTCNFSGEYSVLIDAVSGNSYRFTTSISADYFTIRSGSPGGPVVGSGTQPLTVTAGVSGSLYVHINSSADCPSDVTCRQTAVQCTSCAGGGCINSTVYPALGISLSLTNTTGAVQQITSCQFSGEYYSVADVIAGKSYTFSSSAGTDWITVRVGTFNGTILGQGAGSVAVTPSTTAPLFIHNNANASCGTNTICRVSSVQCTNCLCQNSIQFPSSAVSLNPTNTTGATQTVTTCNFATEYFVLTNVLALKNYTITSSVGTDWLTVRGGSAGGPVLFEGTTPLAITPTSITDLYVHVNTNFACGTNSTCRITAVQCTNCDPTPPCIPSPTFPTNGSTACPTAMVVLSWPASIGATSYDVYFGTTAVPPFVGNVVSNSMAVITPTMGTYFWRIAPRNASGPTTSCTTWSFTRQDIAPPTIQCFNQTVIFNGETSIPLDPNNLVDATDNCGIQSISLSSNSIASSQIGQTIPVLVTVTDVNGNSATCTSQITVSGLPSGWSQNINGVGCANGNNIVYNESTEVWTATSTNCYYSSPFTSDATAFAQRTLCGNGSITAEITGIGGTALGWAGIIMRENNAPGARKVQLMTNLSNLLRREVRSVANGPAVPQQSQAFNRYWLRLVRTGNQIVGYSSSNGINWFQAMAINMPMNACIEMGLVVTNYDQYSSVTATFENVSYTGNGPVPAATPNGNGVVVAMDQYQPDFSVYPNPTSGELNIDLQEYIGKNVQIELYSLEGKLMQLIQLDEILQNTQTMLLDRYASGMYFVKLKSAGLPDVIKRFVIQKS